MSLTEKKYAAYWAASGMARPNTVLQFWRDKRQADRLWAAEQPSTITGLGAVTHLSILPLVEYSRSHSVRGSGRDLRSMAPVHQTGLINPAVNGHGDHWPSSRLVFPDA